MITLNVRGMENGCDSVETYSVAMAAKGEDTCNLKHFLTKTTFV